MKATYSQAGQRCLERNEQPTAQNRFSGNNRRHWCHADYDRFVESYRTDLREAGCGETIRQIHTLLLDELLLLPLIYRTTTLVMRTGVVVLEDGRAGGWERRPPLRHPQPRRT